MTQLTPDQNIALGELNVALYKAKNTGLLELLSGAKVADDFYKLVGKLCVDNRVLGDSAGSGDPNAVFTARVKAVMHDRGLIVLVLTMGVSDPDIYQLNMPWEPWPPKETLIRYEVEVSRAGMGRALVVLPPETDNVLQAVHQIMFCRIPATLRRQAIIDDHAVDIDDGEVHFNAMAKIIKMDLETVQEMFARGVDFDELANGLPEREAHNGPFEVNVQEDDVVRMVCLLSCMHGALGENDSISDIKQPMWDDFVTAANSLLLVNGGDLYGQLDMPEQEADVALEAP